MGKEGAVPEPPDTPSYFTLTRDLSVSLILVLPLLAVYQVGLLLTRFRLVNGVDFLTRFVYQQWGEKGVVLANLTVIAIFLAAIIRLEKQRRFRPGLFAPLVAESTVYASLLGSTIFYVMQSPTAALALGGGAALPPAVVSLVLSIGAGVNEEIVFRLLLVAVLTYIFSDLLGARERPAFAVAALVSALLFSGAHYVGRYGDAFSVDTFVFRALAGLVFAGICRWRSFAVAAYTHAIYDILVFFR
jgi:lysylphosphatidylglycerol synthetase-like protein (DUF2156 family)